MTTPYKYNDRELYSFLHLSVETGKIFTNANIIFILNVIFYAFTAVIGTHSGEDCSIPEINGLQLVQSIITAIKAVNVNNLLPGLSLGWCQLSG